MNRANELSTTNSLLSKGTWVALDSVASRGLTAAAMMLVATRLGSNSFGELAMIQITLVMIAALISDALKLTLTRQIASEASGAGGGIGALVGFGFSITFAIGSVIATLLYLVAPMIALRGLGSLGLLVPLRYGLAFVLTEALNGVAIGTLTGLQSFRAMAIGGIFAGTVSVGLLAAASNYSVSAVVLAQVCSSLFSLLVRCHLIKAALDARRAILRITVSREHLAILLRLGLPAMIAAILWTPANWIVTVMLANSQDGYRQLGMVAAANQWFSLVMFVPSVVGIVLFPRFAHEITLRQSVAVRATLTGGIRSSLAIALPLAGVVIIFSGYIMRAYGASFTSGQTILVLMSIAAMLGAIQNLLSNFLASADRMWSSMAAQGTWVAVFVGSSWILIRHGTGGAGVATATLVAYCAKTIHMAVSLRRCMANLE